MCSGRLLLLFGLWCLVSHTTGQQSRLTCGRRRVKSVYLIHNGIDAKAGHWPWHAAIFHRKQGKMEYACGGVIIDESTILTAAHCIYTTSGKIPPNRIAVSVGQIDLKEENNEYTQKHNVQETIVHPKYGSASIINDIALLKLSTFITMTKYVQPVCLWTMESDQEMIVGRNGTIVGFGLNEEDVVSKQLKQALIGVVDALTCIASDRSVFGTHLTSDIYCGRGQTGVSACNGDSGGGMFFEVGGKWFVRGLVSFTPLRGNTGLCDPLKYTAYTDVAKHFEWIVQYVDQRVLSFESDILDIDYEEKLRLFKFDTCGAMSSTLLSDGNSWTLPWLGFVIFAHGSDSAPSTPRCTVTLISDWYAIGPAHCFDNDGIERWILLGGDSESSSAECTDRNGTSRCTYPTQTLQIERIITHPKYDSNTLGDNIVLIELLKAANTSLPNVRPICIAATPELRTTQMTNLSVASLSTQTNSYRSEAVSLANTDVCKTQYADLGFTISWQKKRFCAQIPEAAVCGSLKSGAPLQELRSFGDTSRYFLQGFELFGRACGMDIPPVYNNIDDYLDWILYNMRYSVVDKGGPIASVSVATDPKESLDKEWDALQQQPGKEKLHLFNMTTCGLPTSRKQNLGRVTILPWVGFFQGAENVTDEASWTKSLAVLISEWYAIVPRRSVTSNITWRLLILGKYNPDDPTNCYTSTCEITHQMVEIKRVITPPADQPRQTLALVELLEPANLNIPYISPICLPFMQQLYRNKPSEVTISSNRQFTIVSKKLTMIDYLNCQQRLLLATHLVTFDGDFPCAIEAEKLRQVSLSSSLGSPLQRPVRMGGRTRYFLYGMDMNEENIFSDLVYGPYLFSTLQLADLDWIVENMQPRERNVSAAPIETRRADRVEVSLPPVPDSFKRNLFNFNTCGLNTLLSESSSRYPIPWTGNVFSNAPFFNVSRCSVTLVSEWYAVGPAYCYGDVTQKHYILFGFSGDSTNRECAESNTTAAPCELPTQRILVEKIILHPQYDRASYSNDIALAKFATPVDTSQPHVKPICLPLLDEVRSYDLSNLMISSTTAKASDYTVTSAETIYIPQDDCQRRWTGLAVSFTVDSTKSCFITRRSLEENCIGVFAGAALHTLQGVRSSKRHFLRGFAAILPRGCSVYYPAVYTNTDHYLGWILENMDEPLYPSDGSTDMRERLIFN